MSKVTLALCPIGLFLSESGELCLKTEYGNNEGRIDAYIVRTGEFFWGANPQTIATQRMQPVTPVDADGLTLVGEPELHKREEVATSDATMPLSRYRVDGGWLYHAHPDAPRNGQFAALCFVPDEPE